MVCSGNREIFVGGCRGGAIDLPAGGNLVIFRGASAYGDFICANVFCGNRIDGQNPTLLLFLSMPIVLGSIYAFFLFLAYPFILVLRIKKEESCWRQSWKDIVSISKG